MVITIGTLIYKYNYIDKRPSEEPWMKELK